MSGGRFRLTAVAAAAMTVGATILCIAPANATVNTTHWGVVDGIGCVNVRDYWGGLSAPVIGHANNQDRVTVCCYLPGAEFNSSPYWDLVNDLNGYYLNTPARKGVAGFFADAYVYMGGDFNTPVPRCVIPVG